MSLLGRLGLTDDCFTGVSHILCKNMSGSVQMPLAAPFASVPAPQPSIPLHLYSKPEQTLKDSLPVEKLTGRWSREEHQVFLKALDKFGRDWKKMSTMIKTRTVIQIRTHAQKYFQKLEKNPALAEASKNVHHFRKRTASSLPRPHKKRKALKLQKPTLGSNKAPTESSSGSPTSIVSFDFTPEISLTESAAANLFPGVFSRCLGSPISSPADEIFMDPVDPNWDQFVL